MRPQTRVAAGPGVRTLASPSRRTDISLLDKNVPFILTSRYGTEGALYCIVISQTASLPTDTRG